MSGEWHKVESAISSRSKCSELTGSIASTTNNFQEATNANCRPFCLYRNFAMGMICKSTLQCAIKKTLFTQFKSGWSNKYGMCHQLDRISACFTSNPASLSDTGGSGGSLSSSKITRIRKVQLGHEAKSSPSNSSWTWIVNLSPQGHG